MKIDFSQAIKGLNGEVLQMATKEGATEDAILSKIVIEAMMGTYEDERGLSGVEKVKRYSLCEKINGAAEVDVPVEDLSLIKSLVGKAYPVVLVGPTYKLLDA